MKKMSFIISSIIIFLFVIGGISYAYLLPIITGSSENISVLAGDMVVTLTDGAAINATDFIPGDTIIKTFTIQNNGTVKSNYQIYLDEVLNTFNTKSEVVYTLSSTNGGASVTNNTVYPSGSAMIASGSINSGVTQSFTLTIRYLDLVSNDINNMGKTIKGKIKVNEYTKYARLVDGPTFNEKIKTLAGTSADQELLDYFNANPEVFDVIVPLNVTNDTNITSILISDSAPESSVTTDIVSSNDSDYEIVAWFDNGTIYLYSEASELFFNENSSYMFAFLSNLPSLNLTGFNSIFSENMGSLFYYGDSLVLLNLGDNFDTSNVVDMSNMFGFLSQLETLDLGDKFDTSSVVNMAQTFDEMSSLQTLDLGDKFDTSNVIRMPAMFRYMVSLETLYLGDKFDTSKVNDFSEMFYKDFKLTTIYTSKSFDLRNLYNISDYNIFDGNILMVGGSGTTYDSNKTKLARARIDCGVTSPGYFTFTGTSEELAAYCATASSYDPQNS